MAANEIEAVFLIADLCGYTALTEAHGNVQAAHAVTRYADICRTVLEPGTRLFERVGDEVAIVAENAASAVQTAVALRDAVDREPRFPTLRTGINAGTVVEDGGRYFGSALNVAARVAGHARAGQILCTQPVVIRAGDLEGVEYQSVGPVRFKNIVDPVHIFEVIADRERSEATTIDPVCRMQVTPDTAPARLPFADRTYYFCSFDCAKAFAERPEDYTRVR